MYLQQDTKEFSDPCPLVLRSFVRWAVEGGPQSSAGMVRTNDIPINDGRLDHLLFPRGRFRPKLTQLIYNVHRPLLAVLRPSLPGPGSQATFDLITRPSSLSSSSAVVKRVSCLDQTSRACSARASSRSPSSALLSVALSLSCGNTIQAGSLNCGLSGTCHSSPASMYRRTSRCGK